MEWKKVKLGEVGRVVGGATPSTRDVDNYDGNIAWITPKDLSTFSGRFICRGERMITQRGFDGCSCVMLPKGSVLFSSRAPIGYIAIAENELCTNQGFKSVIPNEDTDGMFLYYLLQYYKDYIAGLGSGTTFMEVSGKTMREVEVCLPSSIEDQHRIAAILSSLDAQIENNNRINANLEAQAQALFKSWFVDFEPWGGVMPEDWKEGKLGDIAEITMGQSPAGSTLNTEGNGTIFYQGCSDFGFRFPSVRVFTTAPTRYAEFNSVLFSVRAPVGAVNVALTPCAIGRGLASIRAKGKYQSYILYLIKSLNNQFDSFNGEGSVFGCINKKSLEGMQIVCPSTQVLTDFESKISCLDDKIRNNTETNARLAALRDTLLPKLMKGEIEL